MISIGNESGDGEHNQVTINYIGSIVESIQFDYESGDGKHKQKTTLTFDRATRKYFQIVKKIISEEDIPDSLKHIIGYNRGDFLNFLECADGLREILGDYKEVFKK